MNVIVAYPTPVSLSEPNPDDFETVSEWRDAWQRWDDLCGKAYLRLSDALPGGLEWNGPSGVLLGARLLCEERFLGVPVTDWSLRQVTDLLNRVRQEYNHRWHTHQQAMEAAS
jgi:hypothetical protein